MGYSNFPKYDRYCEWIQNCIEKQIPWDEIRYAKKKHIDGLIQFLNACYEEIGWPQVTVEEWFNLVDEMKEYKDKQLSVVFPGSDGVLFDVKQDNQLDIPMNERSSWQLYKNSLNWKPSALEDLEKATVGILRRLSDDTRQTGPIKGLVVGHVQSGKTANMEALMSMAADHGWNMFIVLSGTIENLRIQTLRRMQKDLNQEGNLVWRGIEHPSKKSQYGERAVDFNFKSNSSQRFFTVCLKNTARLKKLIDWIHYDKASHEQMKILIIDDEADQASISNNAVEYKKEQKERKGINKLIVNLVSDTHYKDGTSNGNARAINYVMYTATPYANFLNECTEESLYPRNFIWTLKTSDEYIGPNQIYGGYDDDNLDGLDIKRVIGTDELEKISDIYDYTSTELPVSLKNAICWFVCCTAVMRYWGYKKPISMLVHTSQKQYCHEAISEAIAGWINRNRAAGIMDLCRDVYKYETERVTKDKWISQFKNYGVPKDKIFDYPTFDKIQNYIKVLLGEDIKHIKMNEEGDLQYHAGLHLVIDNCSKNGVQNGDDYVRLAYPDPDLENYPSPAPSFIIVGGSTLSRGLTIEGLVSTFFLRASCQADTLMQMGRWFGYRKGYELMPRIWMTEDTINKFVFLSRLEVELRDDLKKYMNAGISPIEYGPRLLDTPKVSWLRLTSRNHMKNAVTAEVDFSGAKPQTVIFDGSEEVQRKNIEITEAFIKAIPGKPEISYYKNALVWKSVSLSFIMDNFLVNKFQFSKRSRVFNEIESFCEWIKKLLTDDLLNKWSVIVAGKDEIGTGDSKDSKRWNIIGYNVNKVNRSRKKTITDDTSIDIGALRSLKDLVSDVDSKVLDEYKDLQITKQEHVDFLRKTAGVDNVPLLIIYRIDGQSKARENDKGIREDMNFSSDIIGIQICVPGDQVNKKYSKKITIHLPEKEKEDEVEENA